MGTIPLKVHCVACNGTGIRWYSPNPNAPLIEENPCSICEGIGKMNGQFALDSELLEDISNKVNDIKEKVDEIMDKLNEE